MANVFAEPTRSDDFQFWRCGACGQQMGYQQPINFRLQLNLLNSFMDRHEVEHGVASRPAHYLPDAEKLIGWPKVDTHYSEYFGRLEPFSHIYRRAPWDKFLCVWPGTGEVSLRQYQPGKRDYCTLFSGTIATEQDFDKLLVDFGFAAAPIDKNTAL